MLFTETPTEPKPPPSATPPPPSSARLARVLAGRHGEWDTHELIRLLDTIEDERARGRFRESLYISIFVWIVVAWFIFYGPRVLWHQPELRDPASVLRERELTQLTMPSLPKLSTPAPKPVRPTIDTKTMDNLRAMAARQPAREPAPTPQPNSPPPAPVATAPPPPPVTTAPTPHLPAPVVAEAPTAQPNFTKQSSAGNAIQEALNAAARNHTGGSGNTPSRRSGPLNVGGAEVLSDTQGVDFGPYLRRILSDIKRNWDPLIPPEAESPLFKQGESYIRFKINPDGSIAEMHLDGSTHDEAINRSCWGSITSEGQFPPLPKEFHGQNLELRIHYLVNKQPPSE